MKALTLSLIALLLGACVGAQKGPSGTGTGAEKCQSATHKLAYPATRSLRIQMCVTPGTAQRHAYSLSIDGAKVLEAGDEQAETLVGSYQDYRVTGSCLPQGAGAEARTCTVLIDGQQAASFVFRLN
jgi:hypothetical protein